MKTAKISLSDALFPKVRQQVLGLFYGQPQKSFYTNEIIRMTGKGTGAVQRELERLSSSGILLTHIDGRQKRYQANLESPLFNEISNIVLKTFGLGDVIKDALNPVIEQIKLAFIYGSVARNEDTAKSDVDLVMISETLAYTDVFPLLEKAEQQLGRPINPTFFTEKEWMSKHSKKHHFIEQLIKGSKIFIIGTEDELRKLGKSR